MKVEYFYNFELLLFEQTLDWCEKNIRALLKGFEKVFPYRIFVDFIITWLIDFLGISHALLLCLHNITYANC